MLSRHTQMRRGLSSRPGLPVPRFNSDNRFSQPHLMSNSLHRKLSPSQLAQLPPFPLPHRGFAPRYLFNVVFVYSFSLLHSLRRTWRYDRLSSCRRDDRFEIALRNQRYGKLRSRSFPPHLRLPLIQHTLTFHFHPTLPYPTPCHTIHSSRFNRLVAKLQVD